MTLRLRGIIELFEREYCMLHEAADRPSASRSRTDSSRGNAGF